MMVKLYSTLSNASAKIGKRLIGLQLLTFLAFLCNESTSTIFQISGETPSVRILQKINLRGSTI